MKLCGVKEATTCYQESQQQMSAGEPALHTWLTKEFAVAFHDFHIAGKLSLRKKAKKGSKTALSVCTLQHARHRN